MAEASLELIQTMLVRVLDTVNTHTTRFERLEDQMALLNKSMLAVRYNAALDAEVMASVNDHVRALDLRVDRIERRLQLRDA